MPTNQHFIVNTIICFERVLCAIEVSGITFSVYSYYDSINAQHLYNLYKYLEYNFNLSVSFP